MKKFLAVCLLAVMSVSGGVSYVNAQSEEKSVVVSGASEGIARFCSDLDKAVDAIKENPSDLPGALSKLGGSVDDKALGLDRDQKLTPADKEMLKKSMLNLMEVVVTTQIMENPQMSQMFGSMPEDQKKEMIAMAMQTVSKEVSAKIDACETLGDFAAIAGKI